jgi:hypothetical protein
VEYNKLIKDLDSENTIKKEKKGGCLGGCLFVIICFILLFLGVVWIHEQQHKKPTDSKAMMDVKNAYTAAQAYFLDYPDATVSFSKLTSYGFVQSSDVVLTVLSGNKSNLKISAFHTKGKKIYKVDSGGNISQKRK